jgi:flagellar biosynthesis/type III secretory pathway protein FliH
VTARAVVGAVATDCDVIAALEAARKAGYEAGYAAARIEVAERLQPVLERVRSLLAKAEADDTNGRLR